MTNQKPTDSVVLCTDDLDGIWSDSIDEQWKIVLRLAVNGEVESACRLATHLLKHELKFLRMQSDVETNGDLAIIDGLVGSISNLAINAGCMGTPVIELFCSAVDLGLYDYAYNAASGLMKIATSPQDYLRAQTYFKICIATTPDPSLKAAALINYCPIIRDGLISGTPDYEEALSLYRQAANLGLVTGMINFANICAWQISNHDASHAEEAAIWLNRALSLIESNAELLNMDNPEHISSIHEEAVYLLAKFNIDGILKDSSFDTGVELLKKSIRIGVKNLPRKRWNLECAYAGKLMMLHLSDRIRIHAWYEVLSVIGWRPSRPIHMQGFEAELMEVGNADERIPLVVMDKLFYPERIYKTLTLLDEWMQQAGMPNYFVVSRHAIHAHTNDHDVIPLVIITSGARYLGAINLQETPFEIRVAAEGGREFTDPINFFTTCILALTINVINSRQDMSQDSIKQYCYLELENKWRLPFCDIKPLLKFME